jgi:hypothetical protein
MRRRFTVLFFASSATALSIVASPSAGGQAVPNPAQVTFTKDVAPILQDHCQVCHRPGTFAPMSLLTYEEVRPWARAIRAKVAAREMPPFFIEKAVGIQHFLNDNSLTDQQIATIARWVEGGAPQGSAADMPPPRRFPDDQAWQIGQPDLIVTLPADYVVKANGPDRWPDILVDPGLTEDRYIKGVQIMTLKGHPVIHHIRTSVVQSEDDNNSGETDGRDGAAFGEQGVFLNEYALGKAGDVFPEGTGRLIKAGVRINFQLHVHSTGTDTPANVALGLKFYPKGYVPRYVIVNATIGGGELDIRPNTDNVRTDGYTRLARPTKFMSWQPHMHNRGKASCLEAIYPDGRTEMLNCARFIFNWHINYLYDPNYAPLLPAGTILHSITWHNNTRTNPGNPDPDAMVTSGQRTIDEMNTPWTSYYYLSDDDFAREVAARKALGMQR